MQTSIIIINYNTFDLTYRCIKSIFDHEEQNSFEIILIDNASTECDAEIFKDHFQDITLIKSETNLGFAGGNNLGIQKAKGEFILLLNSDTEFINNAASIATNIIDQNSDIGVLSGQLQYPNGELQAVAGKFPSIKRELRELLRFNKALSQKQRSSYFLGSEWDYTQPTEADWVWGTFFIFRKSDLALFPKGRLHDTFFMYGEDVQWCYHFKNVLKRKVLYTPDPKIIHYLGGSEKNKQIPFNNYVQKLLPNEYKWLCMTKGKLYTKIYYLTKSLIYFSLRDKNNLKIGKLFLSVSLNGLNK